MIAPASVELWFDRMNRAISDMGAAFCFIGAGVPKRLDDLLPYSVNRCNDSPSKCISIISANSPADAQVWLWSGLDFKSIIAFSAKNLRVFSGGLYFNVETVVSR